MKNLTTLLLLTSLGWYPAYAEIVTDGSLGVATDLTGPNFAITTDLGQQRGGNLFHSFSLFNLTSGQQANFVAGNGIQNIIARVTGGSISSIDGVINSESAGLWMINPAGWVFGANASINVKGAFHVSSADGVRFEDGSMFYADPASHSVLSASPAIGLSFLQPQQARITLDETILEMPERSTLSITATQVTLHNATIKSPQGRILIGATASAGDWEIDHSGLKTDNTSQFGSIEISNDRFMPGLINQVIDISSQTSTAGQGKIQLVSSDTLLQNAKIFALTFGAQSSGEIELQNQGDLNIAQSDIRSDALSGSSGHAGNISLTADNLNMLEDSSISASSQPFSSGNTGTINIDVAQNLTMSGLNTQIFSVVNGQGNGSTIKVSANSMTMSELSAIRATTGTHSDAGNIEISTQQLILEPGTTIGSSALGLKSTGNSGNININTELLEMTDALITSSSFNQAGKGGDIQIQSSQITLIDQAEIRAKSVSSAGAGNIIIKNTALMQIDDGIVSTEAVSGNGGNISLSSQDIVLTDAQITTSLEGDQGDGGNIQVSSDVLAMNTGFIQANTSAAGGRGGDIVVNARQFIPSRGLVAVGGEQRVPYVPNSGLNVIQAAAPNGVSGQVTVSNVELNITGEIQPIKSSFSSIQVVSDNPCQVKRGQALSSLLVTGQGGLPVNASEDVLLPISISDTDIIQDTDKTQETAKKQEITCLLDR